MKRLTLMALVLLFPLLAWAGDYTITLTPAQELAWQMRADQMTAQLPTTDANGNPVVVVPVTISQALQTAMGQDAKNQLNNLRAQYGETATLLKQLGAAAKAEAVSKLPADAKTWIQQELAK